MAEGKWLDGLSAGMPVADAAQLVLAARFGVVRESLSPAAERPYEDVEHVHQLRVGTRRAGAALRVFADCLPRKHRKAAQRALRSLRRAAGDARDWDVFRLQIAAAGRPTSSADERPGVDLLLGYALGERAAAQTRLVHALAEAGPGFAEEAAVLPTRARLPRRGKAPHTFGGLATVALGDLLREFSAAVGVNPEEPHALHQIRILGKRLRYGMEIFAPCFTPPFREVLYPAVESLQETLGESQDAVIGVERLEELRELVKRVIPDEWPRLEPGIEGLMRDQRAVIASGRERFREWRTGWASLLAQHPPEPQDSWHAPCPPTP